MVLLALIRPATAAPPVVESPAAPNLGSLAQGSGVTLEKKASAETIPLGHPVTYTVTIRNDGRETVNPTLTDQMPSLPAGLSLQTHSITATSGQVKAQNNTLTWSGSVGAGEQVTVEYAAVPPSTSEAGRTVDNVARLDVGGSTLEAKATITTETPQLGFWGQFVNIIAHALVFFDGLLEQARVPYAFGFAIILFTLVIRLVTFPLNMQQIKASKAMQELQPRMKELQEKYKGDREKLAQEQMNMYKEAGVNPLGGCLPTLVQMPIWFGLYQALMQLYRDGLLHQGFFWIPSLAGPISESANGGMGWLWPLPPAIGWGPAIAYLVLPVLLVISQLYMQEMMTPPSPDPQQASMNSMMRIMPFMFGYFALVVPSGLSLYWITSNLLAMAQQYFTKTHLNPAPVASPGTPISSPVPSNPVPAPSGEDSKDKQHAKTNRKSRRKR